MFQFFSIHLILLASVVGIVSCGSPKKAFDRVKHELPLDVIIVPGVPFDSAWSDIMRIRVLWSYHLYKEGLVKNIIYSGSAVYTPYIESRIMALYAKELGIPSENIFTEERAEHSVENVFYSYHMAKNLGFNKIGLATDPFQTIMVKSFIRKNKMEIRFIPTMFDTIHMHYPKVSVAINAAEAKVETFTSITARENYWKRLAGTFGHNIKYSAQEITNASMKFD
ncbi:YdcF family protein [Bacteroidota bacterium]